ncbi:MAG: hypothetical protein WDM96_05635 [Lacunisphaera sp.]
MSRWPAASNSSRETSTSSVSRNIRAELVGAERETAVAVFSRPASHAVNSRTDLIAAALAVSNSVLRAGVSSRVKTFGTSCSKKSARPPMACCPIAASGLASGPFRFSLICAIATGTDFAYLM